GEDERDPGARDRGGARAAVRLEHVAVEPERPLAEVLQVVAAADRPADEPLDLDRAALLAPGARLAAHPLAGGRGEHPVFGRQPALALALEPARDPVLDRGRAQHARRAD